MEFKSLEDGETAISLTSNMFKHKELMKFIIEAFRHRGLDRLGENIWESGRGRIPLGKSENDRQDWLENGIECEILKPNSMGWEKGKIRINIKIQFCPNEEDSPLDPVRQNHSVT